MAHFQRSGSNWTVGPANGKISTLEPPEPTIQSTPLQMVLSILIAAIITPGLLGSQEAIRQSQSKEKKEEHRARRCNLIATCVKSSNRSREIDGRQVVLRNGKLWIDTGAEDGSPLGHPYAGYYLPYPDTEHEGLVTTITDVAPIMNWVYIDKQTHEVRYGVRADAQPNFTGPFDCTRQDRRLTFGGWEGFCAVEQAPGLWGLYFDVDDNGLKGKVEPGMRVLEIELSRKEKRFLKEKDERMADQTTKREVDGKEEAPVDKPLRAEALVSKPGVVAGSVGHADEEGVAEPAPLRPLNIPKSIFDDPPSRVEPLVFRPPPTPKTPPPAYSPAVPEEPVEPAEAVYSEDMVEGPSTVPETTRYNNSPTPDEASPLGRTVTPPIQPQSPPTGGKRTTPKLNRSSATRALAQAQRFEDMTAAQQPSAEVQRRSNKRGSRANSNTSSVYSNQDDAFEPTVGIQAQSSPTPAPLAIGVSKANASAASGAVSDPSVQRPVTPPRQRAPSATKDPAMFGSKPAASARAAPLSRRPSAPREPATTRTSTPRSTSQSSVQRSTRQRERSASERSSSSSTTRSSQSPMRASARANAVPARASLARTMTSGKGNQGMTNRMTDSGQRRGSMSNRPIFGQSRLRAPTAGRKTTSTLFRELDDLVSQDNGGASGGTGDSATVAGQKRK